MAATVRRGGPSARIASAASSARSVPSAPSKRPPSGGVSRCDPLQISGRSGSLPESRPTTLPAASNSTSSPRLAHPAPPRARMPAARPRPGRAGWCRPRARSRRACRAARECARRATPGWRFGTPPESARAGCSRARVCQGEGDSHANGERAGAWRNGCRARDFRSGGTLQQRPVEEGDDAALVLPRVRLGAVHVLASGTSQISFGPRASS